MKIEEQFKTILWDFDGVIMNSNEVRDKGFVEVLKSFPKDQVDELISFHKKNGGLSRYVKFRHFFEDIRGETVTDEQLSTFTNNFSEIMLKSLLNPNLLFENTMQYIEKWSKKVNMHIVSGSDQEELRFVCKSLQIDSYFKSIYGSPIPKIELVRNILSDHKYNVSEVTLIGDSINDYEAAEKNDISFIGFNNEKISALGVFYLESF